MGENETSYADAFAANDRVVLAIGDGDGVAALADAASVTGARLAARISPADAPARLQMQARLHVVAIDVQDDLCPRTVAALDAVADAARRHDARVIASFPTAAIDIVVAALDGVDATLLCEPTAVERVGAFALATPPGHLLHDAARDAEHQRLRHLNDEVARIAETLARLARDDFAPVTTRLNEHVPPFRAGPEETDIGIDAAQIRATIRARRLRDQFFDGGLFADPAWDMLLDLFAAHLEHVRVSVSSLCIAAAVPPTTALRWITTMREGGLLERHDDPFDRRRAYVGLSETALSAMRRYCGALRRAGLALP